MLVPEEHKQAVDLLLVPLVELAMEHDGLVEPDETTLRILRSVSGTAFSLGVAYGGLSERIPWRERLNRAFEVVRERER